LVKSTPRLNLTLLPQTLALCSLDAKAPWPDWAQGPGLVSLTRTPEELSLICPQDRLPPGLTAQRDWRCFKVHGPLEPDQTGVLAALAEPLAQAGVSLLVVSTFETDYILIKEADLARAVEAWERAEHHLK